MADIRISTLFDLILMDVDWIFVCSFTDWCIIRQCTRATVPSCAEEPLIGN